MSKLEPLLAMNINSDINTKMAAFMNAAVFDGYKILDL